MFHIANGAVFNLLGPGVPGRAILSHIMLMKKKFKDEIASGTHANTATSVSKKRTALTTFPTARKKAKQAIKDETESDLGDEADILKVPTTSQKTPSKISSSRSSADASPTPAEKSSGATTNTKRSSPRATRAVNYNELNGSFMAIKGATDEDGENVFGEDEGNSSDDSADSDELYAGPKEEYGVDQEDQEA